MKQLLALIAVALALPAAAQAKEIGGLAVCGPEECEDADVAGFGHGDPIAGAIGEGEAPPPSAFLRLDFTVDGHVAAFSIFYEPVSGLVATKDQFGHLVWSRLAPVLAGAVQEAAKRVEPFPAPQVTAVRVGARKVDGEPSSYLSLLAVEGPSVAPKTASSGLAVVFFGDPNPWTETRLLYYPADDVLQRGARLIKLPAALAADIEAGRTLGTGGGGGETVPWLAIAVALAGALLLAALFLRARSLRRRALVVAGLLALALPAGAAAKGPVSAELCGPDDCRAVAFTPGFDGTAAAPPPRPYYELRLDFGGGHTSRGMYYEPLSGLVSYSQDFGWVSWAPLHGPALDPQGLRPYPAPRLTGVRVDGRPVEADPSSYLRLLTVEGPSVSPKTAWDAERIQLESSHPSPWTDTPLMYYAEDDVLLRGGTFVRLPSVMAADVEARRALGGGATIVPWLALGTLFAGAAALLLLRTLDLWSASWPPSSSSTSWDRPRSRPGRIPRSSAAA